MPSFSSGPIIGDLGQQAQEPTVPFGAFEGQDWSFRDTLRGLTEALDYGRTSVDPVSGLRYGETEPDISPDVLNQKYGIKDRLSFSNPLPDSIAKSMYEAKRQEIDRQFIAAYSPGGLSNHLKRFGAGFVAGMLDPLNVASTLVPGLGEERIAAAFGSAAFREGGSAVGRFGIRSLAGASQGVIGQAGVSAIRYGQARAEGGDYSIGDALIDTVYGGLLGAGLHAGFGAAGDYLFGHFRAADVDKVTTADRGTLDAALRSSLGQMVDGRPVEVAPVFDAELRRKLLGTTSLASPSEGGLFSPEQASNASIEPEAAALASRVPAATDEGVVSRFETAEDANRVQRRLAKRGDQVDVVPDPAGGFALMRQMDGQPLYQPDGTVLAFATERAAQRAIDTFPALKGRDLSVAPFGAAGERRFILLEGATARDVSGLRARPDLGELARGKDMSARPPAMTADDLVSGAADDLMTGRLRTALDYARGRRLPEHEELSRMADDAEKTQPLPETGPEPDELAQLQDLVKRGHEAGAITDKELEEATDNTEEQRAAEWAKGLMQAAACLMRNT